MLRLKSIRLNEVLLITAGRNPIGSQREHQQKDRLETIIHLLVHRITVRQPDRVHLTLDLLVRRKIGQATVDLLTVDLHTIDQVEATVTADRMCNHRTGLRFNLSEVNLRDLLTTTLLLTVLRAEEAEGVEVLQVALLDHPDDNIKTKENEKIHLNI